MINPEDQFSDFLSQLPIGLFATVCISMMLLFVAFAWFVYFKPMMRARRGSQGTSPVSSGGGDAIDNSNLPDLFALLDTSNMEQEAPIPAAAVVTPAPMPESVRTMPEPAPSPQSAASQPKKSGTYAIKLNTGGNIQANEVISILRDPRDNRLIVHLDNVGYRTLADSPQVKQKFVKIMQELSQVVTEADELDPALDLIDDQLLDEPEPIFEPEPEPAPPQPKRTSAPPPIDTSGAMPGDLPSYRLEDSVIPTPGGKYQAAPVPELNIAASIEAYLQHKLRHTDEYTGRQIHVLSAPGGGVRIQVDNTFYEAVGDVADADVREFLSETIQEWQDRQ